MVVKRPCSNKDQIQKESCYFHQKQVRELGTFRIIGPLHIVFDCLPHIVKYNIKKMFKYQVVHYEKATKPQIIIK